LTQKLGDWLRGKGKITEEQLQRALQDKAFFGERLGNSLIKLGLLDEDTLGEYLAEQTRTRYAPAQRLENVPPEVIAAVPARLAVKYCIVPIAIERRRLHLAMRDPKDLIALDEIAFLTGLPIEPYVATEFRLIRAIERHYNINIGTRAIPVAPGPADPARPKGGPRPVIVQPLPEPEMGLDGLPLNAQPEDLDQPFVGSTGSGPPPAMETPEAVPSSLEAWREQTDGRPARHSPTAPRPGGATPVGRPAAGVRDAVAPARSSPAPAATPPRPSPGAPRPGPVAVVPSVAAEPSPPASTLESVSGRLRQAETRDEVFDAVLDFTVGQFSRAALFVVQQDRVLGWSGRGGGLQPSRVRNVIVPLDRPSLFVFFRTGGDYFYGPVPDLPANAKFYLDLGCPPPARVLLVPLKITDKPAVILYADNGPDATTAPDIARYRRLLKKAALALEILILRNKIMMA
jgi:type II secretion system (T2SS) protein E